MKSIKSELQTPAGRPNPIANRPAGFWSPDIIVIFVCLHIFLFVHTLFIFLYFYIIILSFLLKVM